jgi:hypothetical protein
VLTEEVWLYDSGNYFKNKKSWEIAVYICSKQNFITLDIDEQQRRLFYEIAYNYLTEAVYVQLD